MRNSKRKQGIRPVLFCLYYALVGTLAAGEAGSGGGATARQGELLRELVTLAPAGYSGPGPWMLDVWDTDAGLVELARLPTGEGNAAASFRRLDELYVQEKDELQNGGADSRGVTVMLEAAEIAECRLTPNHYPEFDKTTAKQPDFVVLRTYLQALLRRGEAAFQMGDARETERCFRAALICGWHLTRDRTSTLVYMTGVIFKLRGAQSLEALWRRTGGTERAETAKRYIADLSETLRLMYWKANVGMGELAAFASLSCIVRIATGDKEPSWRKEAVARLAVLRHGAPDAENKVVVHNQLFQRTAEEALSAVAAKDPDPSVRRMAVWAALNIKPEMFEEYTHRFE